MDKLEHREKLLIMVAVMSATFFAGLNQTIISTTLPRIVTQLGGMEYFTWVFTIYMVTSMIPMVIVGKLSDIHGRRPFLLTGICIFMLGALLSGLSTDILQLIAFRGLQGIGGGIIMSTSFATVGDLFPSRERGNWMSLLTATFGVSSLIGPPLGGYIVDQLEWQWVFWVFIPVGIVAFAMIWALYPKMSRQANRSIDYLGATLLSVAIIFLMLAFSLVEQEDGWFEIESIALLGACSISLLAFIITEKYAPQPILPLHLFRNNVFALSLIISFFLGATVFGSTIYIPLFLQAVLGTTATVSGYYMIPWTICMVAGTTVSGRRLSRDGRYKNLCIFALAITVVALYQLSTVTPATPGALVILYMCFSGIGTGIIFSIMSLTVQDAVDHALLGVATGSGQLFRTLGGTIGVSVMGAVMSIRMNAATDATLEDSTLAQKLFGAVPGPMQETLRSPQLLLNPDKLEQFQSALVGALQPAFSAWLELLRTDFNTSIAGVFQGYAIGMLFAMLLAFFLRETPLRTTFHDFRNDQNEADIPHGL